MKREELKELGLTDEQINKVMSENGKDIEKAKGDFTKLSAELEQTKSDLAKANETLTSLSDYENVKQDVEKYKKAAADSKAEFEKRIAEMELTAKVKDFTSSRKFVNDFTRDAVNNDLIRALNDDANKGKSLDDLLKGLTEGKENIFVDENKPTPPVTPDLKGGNNSADNDGVLAAFKRMNPNINL